MHGDCVYQGIAQKFRGDIVKAADAYQFFDDSTQSSPVLPNANIGFLSTINELKIQDVSDPAYTGIIDLFFKVDGTVMYVVGNNQGDDDQHHNHTKDQG